MNFDIDNEEDKPIRTESIVPPSTFSTKGIRLRLMMLLGMLILVIILMKEAGKPERWEWMGFDKVQNGNANSVPLNTPHASNGDISKLDELPKQDPSSNNVSPNVTKQEFPLIQVNPGTSDYPVAASEFWQSLLARLGDQQQKDFLKLLKLMRHSAKVPTENREGYARLLKVITSQRDGFHQKLFDQLALTSNESPEKKTLSENLNASEDIWEKQILPAMTSVIHGDDFTFGQQQAINRLQDTIDLFIYQQVQDKSSVGWTGDSPTWKRLWEKTTKFEMPEGQPVTRIELMSQPEFYRGKSVKIEGWVRSIRRKPLPSDSELDIDGYYEMWVRPKESKLGPYCVYSQTVPENFPVVTRQFADVNEFVEITGYFFKVRSYVTADRSVKTSPVVVAPSLV